MNRTIFSGLSLRRILGKFARSRKPNRPLRTTLACETLEPRQLLAPLGFGENPLDPLDFGDAPDPTYPTKFASNGARHVADSLYRLGSLIDAEGTGQPDAAARGDDINGTNDDDGVRFVDALRAGETAALEVTASSNGGFLNAWIDYNSDGDWDDPGEQIFTNRRLTAGLNQLEITVSAEATPTRQTFARFRYSTQTGLEPTGWAPNGEVEDYAVAITAIPSGPDQIGSRRGKWFLLDVNANGRWDGDGRGDVKRAFGAPTDIPIAGDFNGDGVDEIGVFRSSTRTFILDANGNRRWDTAAGGDVVYRFGGRPTDQPIVGDWNGDGFDEVGLHRNNKFILDANGNGRWDGVAGGDLVRVFGVSTDTPVIGDFNGDGIDDVGVHRHNKFFLDANGNGRWDGTAAGQDALHRFRNPGETPLIGDWNGDGVDDIGTHIGNVFFVDYNADGRWNGRTGGDELYRFRNPGDTPLIGKWRRPRR